SFFAAANSQGNIEKILYREGNMYSSITRSIRVTVEPIFLEDQSSPSDDHYVWAYQVKIENDGEQTVQLLTRYWNITDAMGRVHEVRGEGVVGEQPTLTPGDAFEYTSGTPLGTPSGIMVGSYQVQTTAGEAFDIEIPAFSLDSPYQARRLN
ncbi:MAG: ApaG protein, partial [Alphaproteobacteria bacterium]